MSIRLNLLIIGLAALLMTGCGQRVVEKLSVTPEAPYNAVGQGKTIVILPFTDYSDDSVVSAQKRNIALNEAITDKLSLNGFSMPIPEDVYDYLVKQKIVTNLSGATGSMYQELRSKDWSKQMKDIFRQEINENHKNDNKHGLTNKEVTEIGKAFGADYIMRGRIIEYKKRQDADGWNAGIVPILAGGTSRSLLGFADADSYDGKSKWVFGDTSSGMIELRLWVQDANSGEIVWTNHTSVEGLRESVFADPQHDALFTAAAERTACLLVHDFATYGIK